MAKRVSLMAWLSCLAVACNSGTDVQVRPCTADNSAAVPDLTVGAYTSILPSPDGCARFSANAAADTIEYVVVAQSVARAPNRNAQFRLAGEAMMTAPALIATAALQAAAGHVSDADRFHYMLRETEATGAYATSGESATGGEPMMLRTPPQVGEQRSFKVCPSLSCVPPMTTVTAVVKAVGQRLALYVDLEAQNSLTQADYDDVVNTFDTRLYALDTLAFGRESDRDGNGVVIVLMTPAINRLVTAQRCMEPGGGFVAGYFFGADLDPRLDFDPNYNKGEVFYALVPDPTGVYSCSHSVSRVKELLPVVFMHELQHMISFNHHVLIPGATTTSTEVLWLNEAMSHYAEELGGRSYLPSNPAMFSVFLSGNIRNAYQYMAETGSHYLVSQFGSGSLGERGAGWLFMRYLVDQLAADTSQAAAHAVTRALAQTTTQGPTNVEARTGISFEITLARWALALWVSDLPGFTAPPELRYRSWAFRTTYGALSPGVFPRPYPLEPAVTRAPDVDITGTLRSGSGVYQRVLHPPGSAPFTLQLASPNGGQVNAAVEPRLTIIRVR